jgi:threonine/homoserine/homoserine lactone efflux protein
LLLLLTHAVEPRLFMLFCHKSLGFSFGFFAISVNPKRAYFLCGFFAVFVNPLESRLFLWIFALITLLVKW